MKLEDYKPEIEFIAWNKQNKVLHKNFEFLTSGDRRNLL